MDNLPSVLKENEYLLKIRQKDRKSPNHKTGFLTKYNKNGSIPVAFDEWGIYKYSSNPNDKIPLPIQLHIETHKSGWEIINWRFGMSQNWATMLHPDGFTVEIYLQDLLELLKTNVLDNGVLVGEFKWENHKLIKK